MSTAHRAAHVVLRVARGSPPNPQASAESRWDDLRSAGASYRDGAANSADPLVKVLTEVGRTVSGAAGKFFRGSGDAS